MVNILAEQKLITMIKSYKNPPKFSRTFKSNEESAKHYDVIVFCHLRWQSVYQRPQHIIGRLATKLKILFVEAPLPNIREERSANLIIINDNLHIIQPNVSDIESIGDIIPKYVRNTSVPMGWFYAPAFSPLLERLNFETIVYDCMGEPLSGNNSKELLEEDILMAHADIVFTNGKFLYESKKKMHSNVYYFPGSVDESHFSPARNGILVPDDIANIQSPIVGYYGIIDNRIDFSLLQEVAIKLPNIAFVLMGYLDAETSIPEEANIHYLGMKSYDELPHYLKAFDVAMMPFALNDSAKYISSAKTLEYMAAGKPIISTKINHVVRDYNLCVSVVEDADEFSNTITFLLDKLDRLSMEVEYFDILQRTSWDNTTDKMMSILKLYAQDKVPSTGTNFY